MYVRQLCGLESSSALPLERAGAEQDGPAILPRVMFMAWHKPTLVNEHTWVINTARVYAVRVNGPGRHGSRGYTLRGTHPARSRLKPGRERLLKKSELVNTKAKTFCVEKSRSS